MLGRVPWRASARRWAHAAAGPAGRVVGRLLRWAPGVPGVAGGAAVTVGVAGSAHAAWHWLPMGYVLAVVGGVFGLLADRRL